MDDPIFDKNQGNSQGGSEPKNQGGTNQNTNGSGNDSNNNGGVSFEQATKMIQEAMNPLASQISDLTDHLRNNTPDPNNTSNPPNTPQDDKDFLTRFSEDPEGSVAGIIQQQIRDGIAPFLTTLSSSASQAFLDLEMQGVEEAFGEGAWDKFFAPHWKTIQSAYMKTNPAALSNRDIIKREINGLKGLQMDDLVKFKDETAKKLAEGEEGKLQNLTKTITEQVRSNLTGGGALMFHNEGNEPTVTEAVEGYLAERTRAIGEDVDPKEWLKATNFGNTLSDFRKHVEGLKGGNE